MTIKKYIASTGGDATTVRGGEAIISAASPISAPWEFLINNETIVETTTLVWTGYSQTSTNTITIKPNYSGSGVGGSNDCGFKSVRNFNTSALDIGTGACVDLGTNSVNSGAQQENISILGLQYKCNSGSGGTVNFTSANTGVNNFIGNIIRGTYGLFNMAGSNGAVVANNLFVSDNAAGSGQALANFQAIGGGPSQVVNNTIIVARVSGANSNWACATSNIGFSGVHYYEFHQNAVYHADLSNGIPYAILNTADLGGDYNIQNFVGTGSAMTGAHSVTSGNISNDFTALPASAGGAADFRPKAGGLLVGFIPSASAYAGTGAQTTDIRGQTRAGVNVDAGAFQTAPPAGDTEVVTAQVYRPMRTRVMAY